MKKRKSYAKVNIFLKMIWVRGDYHELSSRFVLAKNLYDEMWFEKRNGENDHVKDADNNEKELCLEGNFECEMKKNTIYKAYVALIDFLLACKKPNAVNTLFHFFAEHKVVLDKKIPIWWWLWWWSSNAALFLNVVNQKFKLKISQKKLHDIGQKVWADVNFFLSGFQSANVSGVGEIVKEFKEKSVSFDFILPKDISCNTRDVYVLFREKFLDLKHIDMDFVQKLQTMKTQDIVKNYSKEQLNDLYPPAKKLYPALEKYAKPWNFFNGSGSSFFEVK